MKEEGKGAYQGIRLKVKRKNFNDTQVSTTKQERTMRDHEKALLKIKTELLEQCKGKLTSSVRIKGYYLSILLEQYDILQVAAINDHKIMQFQDSVQPWLMECFGEEISSDRQERNHRFLEEALELVQSLDCTAAEAHQLVDYVFNRSVGDPNQEVGGVMVTLAALCLANDLEMHKAGEDELIRIWTKVDAIREKQANKPKHSPLAAKPVHINDIAVGDSVVFRNGKKGKVSKITDKVIDGINHNSSDNVTGKARIIVDFPNGGTVLHHYRSDGMSHHSPSCDIIKIEKKD